MTEPNWPTLIKVAILHLEKGGRVYLSASSLQVIDDVVAGLGPKAIAEKNGFKSDLIGTAIGHVTTAIQGKGSVAPLAEGGWYKRIGSTYMVAPGFAAAWKAVRPGESA